MKNMCAVIRGFIIKINQLFSALRCETVKGKADNSLEISEVIVQQNLFFSQAFNLFSLAILYMTNFLVGALITYK